MTTHRSSYFDLTANNGTGATDACFRSIGAAMEEALLGCGLTRVSTTADWTTATVPTVALTYYEGVSVYRFGDGRSQEVYLKFEWGRGATASGSSYCPYTVRVTVGNDALFTLSASDYACIGGYVGTLTVGNSFIASFSDGVLFLALDDVAATTILPFTLCVERSCTPAGTVNSQALWWVTMGTVNNSYSRATVSPSTHRMNFTTNTVAAQSHVTSSVHTLVSVNGNSYQLFPTYWGANDKIYAVRSFLVANNTVMLANSSFVVDEFGYDVEYVAMRNSDAATGTNTVGGRILYRWK